MSLNIHVACRCSVHVIRFKCLHDKWCSFSYLWLNYPLTCSFLTEKRGQEKSKCSMDCVGPVPNGILKMHQGKTDQLNMHHEIFLLNRITCTGHWHATLREYASLQGTYKFIQLCHLSTHFLKVLYLRNKLKATGAGELYNEMLSIRLG